MTSYSPKPRKTNNAPIFNKLATSVSAALIGLSANTTLAQSTNTDSDTVFEEIIVTATRRSESLQDVPVAVQAIGEKQIKDLRIGNLQDYVSFLPGVNATGQGPGKKEIFIRGISPGRTAVRIAALGSEPGVANYLDETPTSYAGRDIDLYATDFNRIEVLKGPQGTLFGASSQGGATRLITNKPNPGEFEAGVTVDFSDTSGGEGSSKFEAFINIPLIEDQTAVRIAAYNIDEGGYIDNIGATRQIPLSNPALVNATAPQFRETIDNTALVEDDFNDAEYQGFRASLKHNFNDNWSATAQIVSQTLDTEGIFEFEPEVSSDNDLNAQTFNRDFGEDEVDLVALTIEGTVGDLDLIYNGSYTERLFVGQTDYTGYANVGPFIPYYICTPGYTSCGSPGLITDSFFETERTVHELRIASNFSGPFNFIAGLYLDDQDTIERTNFIYPASVNVGFQPNFPIPTAFATDPSVRAPGVTFFNDFLSTRDETSVFGELSYQFNDRLKVTLGARRYSIDIGLTGQSSFGSRTPGPESAGGVNVDANLAGQTPTELSDTIFRLNLSYDLNDSSLAYFTFSEGFRSGGFNRNGGGGSGLVRIPFFFESDNAQNYEVGYKATLLNDRFRFGASAYFVDFTDLQQGVLDFTIDNVSFFDNVGDAEIRGFEIESEWAATDNLRIFSSFSYIDSELVELPPTVTNISPEGSQLPFAPEIQSTAGLRYEHDFGNFTGFAQGVAAYTDNRFTSLVEAARTELDSHTTVNTSLGLGTDNWTATLYVDNLTDELGQLDGGSPDLIFRLIPTRPRTIGVRFNYNF